MGCKNFFKIWRYAKKGKKATGWGCVQNDWNMKTCLVKTWIKRINWKKATIVSAFFIFWRGNISLTLLVNVTRGAISS